MGFASEQASRSHQSLATYKKLFQQACTGPLATAPADAGLLVAATSTTGHSQWITGHFQAMPAQAGLLITA